jgi:hypothetical protein
MSTQLQNPFSGGLANYTANVRTIQDNNIGDSITRLDQVNQARKMSELLGQTNMYNLDEMLPKTAATSMRLSKDGQSQYQNSMQQLAYDKINTIKALTPFMNVGKFNGGGSAGSTGSKGSSVVPTYKSATSNDYGFNQPYQNAGGVDPALVAMQAKTDYKNKLAKKLAGQKPVYYNPSVGDLFAGKRAAAAEQLARLGYIGNDQPAQSTVTPISPAKQLFKPGTKKPVSQKHNQVGNAVVQKPTTKGKVDTTVKTDKDGNIVYNKPEGDFVNEDTVLGLENKKLTKQWDAMYGMNNLPNPIAAEAGRNIEHLRKTLPDQDEANTAITKLTATADRLKAQGAPDSVIQPILSNIERLRQQPYKTEQAIADIETKAIAEQKLQEERNAGSAGAMTQLTDPNKEWDVLNDTQARINLAGDQVAPVIAGLEATQKQGELMYSRYMAEAINTPPGPARDALIKQARYAKAKADEAVAKASTLRTDRDAKKHVAEKKMDTLKFQQVKPSDFVDTKNGARRIKTMEEVITPSVIEMVGGTTDRNLKQVLSDLDEASDDANRSDGKTAWKAGKGLYFTGKNMQEIKAKVAGLIKSAALPSTKSKYNVYMNKLWDTWQGNEASPTEKAEAEAAYKWWVRHVNDKAGHRKKFAKYDQPGIDLLNNKAAVVRDRFARD